MPSRLGGWIQTIFSLLLCVSMQFGLLLRNITILLSRPLSLVFKMSLDLRPVSMQSQMLFLCLIWKEMLGFEQCYVFPIFGHFKCSFKLVNALHVLLESTNISWASVLVLDKRRNYCSVFKNYGSHQMTKISMNLTCYLRKNEGVHEFMIRYLIIFLFRSLWGFY